MKKYSGYIIAGIVAALLIIGAFATSGGTRKDSKFKKITYAEYTELLKSTSPEVLVIGQEGCGYCEQYIPVLKEASAEKDIKISYIDLATFTAEQRNELTANITYLKDVAWGTPTTLVIQDGDSIAKTEGDQASISGYVGKADLIEFLQTNNVIGS